MEINPIFLEINMLNFVLNLKDNYKLAKIVWLFFSSVLPKKKISRCIYLIKK